MNRTSLSSPLALLSAALAALIAFCLGACASTRTDPYAPLSESRRDTARAEQLSRQAAQLIDSDSSKAEALLRDALAADLYHGPAHNNLGVVYLKMDPPRLYEAAGEFEWARKLMPGSPDPRLNLALTLEIAGRTDDALAGYQDALEVDPNHLPTIQALARLQIRSGKADEKTPKLLGDIALRASDPAWRDWARGHVVRFAGTGPPPNSPPNSPPHSPANSAPTPDSSPAPGSPDSR
ncbi:MAG: hypothetical protein AB7O77_10865 [Phycisphaerales bacterium]